jgi:hypothetical protein
MRRAFECYAARFDDGSRRSLLLWVSPCFDSSLSGRLPLEWGLGFRENGSKALACSCYRTPVAAMRTSRTPRCSPPIDRLRLSCTMHRIRTHHTPIRPQECRE